MPLSDHELIDKAGSLERNVAKPPESDKGSATKGLTAAKVEAPKPIFVGIGTAVLYAAVNAARHEIEADKTLQNGAGRSLISGKQRTPLRRDQLPEAGGKRTRALITKGASDVVGTAALVMWASVHAISEAISKARDAFSGAPAPLSKLAPPESVVDATTNAIDTMENGIAQATDAAHITSTGHDQAIASVGGLIAVAGTLLYASARQQNCLHNTSDKVDVQDELAKSSRSTVERLLKSAYSAPVTNGMTEAPSNVGELTADTLIAAVRRDLEASALTKTSSYTEHVIYKQLDTVRQMSEELSRIDNKTRDTGRGF